MAQAEATKGVGVGLNRCVWGISIFSGSFYLTSFPFILESFLYIVYLEVQVYW